MQASFHIRTPSKHKKKSTEKMKFPVIVLVLWAGCTGSDASPEGFFHTLFGGTSIAPTGINLAREAGEGHLDIVKDLVHRGVDVNYGGGEPLVMAARNGHLDVVRYLLEAGANPDGSEEVVIKGSPLRVAARNNHLEIIDLLLEAGATVIMDEYGSGMLSGAAERGYLEAVKKLLAAGADPNFTNGYALLKAAGNGHVDVVKALIEAGADVNTGRGWIMDAAARAGQLESVRILLDAGASRDNMNSSLYAAAHNGHLDVVNLLLERGGNPNYKATLQGAAQSGNIEVVRTLLKAGAKIIYDDEQGFPLHFAAYKGHIDIVILLAKSGGDINKQLRNDIWWDFASPSTNYGAGWSILHVMARFGYPEVDKVIELGADPNLQDVEGRTPLHVAAHYIKLQVVKELLKFCSDVSVLNNKGETAMDTARGVVLREPGNTTEFETLMNTLRQVYPDRLATVPNNDKVLLQLRNDFKDLLKANATLNETLKDVDTSFLDVKSSFYYILEGRDRSGLVEAFQDLYCKPSLPRSMNVVAGTEYLAKCECVPGEGSIMTFTPVEEVDLCPPPPTSPKENPTPEEATVA